ncbi:DUF4145 domain-containing protein [Streptomyces sp. SID4928]|uniref:DUF4145 domain-containing protein n=1 Tax=unclassified Streptomyces TaxID=2593676 RepID=UPI0001C1A079|nr:DUF4145 domain-containing protein [Streptomyces sp. ACT-1]EGE43221.1 hypothetical protein SACT1_3891 [Streptomyces sp. ACT-1]MYR51259.1 DUF4145 domain-containing protein [Streptomyces sp. SID4928]
MTSLTVDQNGLVPPGLCPNCHLHTGFSLRSSDFSTYVWPHVQTEPPSVEHQLKFGVRTWLRQILARCGSCARTVVLHQLIRFHEDGKTGEVLRVIQAWPERRPRELHTSVPDAVRDLFAEGARAEVAEAYRAAGAMYRAAVEELCKDLGAEGNGLARKIDDLVNRGVVREIVEDLHEARILGNWSLHDGLEFSAEEVADVADLIAEAIHILYVQPEERRAMRDARKARRDAFAAGKP